MRQVRRKTADPAARPYLLKAKNEGIKLSWNQFESMLPQDGFGRLGLACMECFQGPCRINPFSRTTERTICGLDRDELVYKGLTRLLSKHGELNEGEREKGSAESELAQREAAAVKENEVGGSERIKALLNLAYRQVARLKAANADQQGGQGVTRQIGLGTLKEDYVNICLEGLSPSALKAVEELAEVLKDEALSRGAKGFNVVLIGDLTPHYSFDTVTNQGGAEFAILTGLVDFYAVGKSGLGLGRNVVASYPTVFAEASGAGYEEVKGWFVQAAVAYTKRDNGKILPSEQVQKAQVGAAIDAGSLKAHLDQGTFKGICIFGGGSSVKVTEDQTVYESATKLAEEGLLCLAYGNAAVTLGKYGLLEENAGAANIAKALGNETGSTVMGMGSELDGTKLFDLLQEVGTTKVVALFPELSSSRDFQMALSLAGAGVKVLTCIKLPVEGSKELAEEMNALIEFVEPKELTEKALGIF